MFIRQEKQFQGVISGKQDTSKMINQIYDQFIHTKNHFSSQPDMYAVYSIKQPHFIPSQQNTGQVCFKRSSYQIQSREKWCLVFHIIIQEQPVKHIQRHSEQFEGT